METKLRIRKIYTIVEDTRIDGTLALEKATRKTAAAAVFQNPFADQYNEDLSLLYQWSEELGAEDYPTVPPASPYR